MLIRDGNKYYGIASNGTVRLVSSDRHKGSHVNGDRAKSKARAEKRIENDDVIRILTSRSKPHLEVAFKL